MRLKELRGVIAMSHKEKAVEYYNNNFNCSQGVFTAFATEMGMEEKLAVSTEFMNRFMEKNGSVVCRELLGYDLTKKEDMAIIQEQNLFRTLCPKMVESAAQILDEMIAEGIC